MRRTHEFFAVVAPGLEKVAAGELAALGVEVGERSHGGVDFKATLVDAFRVNLEARTLTRVLLRLATFRSKGFPELYNKTMKVDWARYVCDPAEVKVQASANKSRLYHTGRLEVTVSMAIKEKLKAHKAAPASEALSVMARLDNDRCTLSLDMSGEPLHKRGYRHDTGRAPLRESMAAGILRWADWHGDRALIDPMCGAGTFPIEAALLAQKRAPGLSRSFAFESWAKWDQYSWRKMKAEAEKREVTATPSIVGIDRSPKAFEAATSNAERAGLAEGSIAWRQDDAAQLVRPDSEPGLVVCNAPYGKRIGSEASLKKVYKGLGGALKSFEGWRVVLLHTQPALRDMFSAALGAKVSRKIVFSHGGLKVTASRFDL